MSEKYKRIYTLSPQDVICENACPVEFVAGAILVEVAQGRKLAQLKFKNVSYKSIRQLTVVLQAFDDIGNSIKGVIEHTYQNVGAANQMEFGSNMPIILSDNNSAKIKVEIKRIEFSDGSNWNKFGEQVTQEIKSVGKTAAKAAVLIPAVIVNTFVSIILLGVSISMFASPTSLPATAHFFTTVVLFAATVISFPGFGRVIFRKKYGFGQRVLRWVIVFGMIIAMSLINRAIAS